MELSMHAPIQRSLLGAGLLAISLAACQCEPARIPSPDGGTMCFGLGGRVPDEHRATATACAPSTRAPPEPDGGLPACTSNADCVGVGNGLFPNCLRGTCQFDPCLSDSDCGDGVCGCADDFYGGNAQYHGNVCVQAGCHVDADCGTDGYCSPSHSRCGTYEGFFCHCGSDPCVNAASDCSSQSQSCTYSPTAGEFTCNVTVCNG
jgi:hypothetical protein